MAEHWIDARTALRLAGNPEALCKRLHAGLITAKAETLIFGDQRGEGVLVPKRFWWAEGHEALEQDWERGDFSTWVDREQHCQAFGVRFGLSGLLQTVPADERASIAHSLSVASNPEWITAKEARRFAYGEAGFNPVVAGPAILQQAKLGFVAARAIVAQGTDARSRYEWAWEEREWPVEQWFWDDFTSEGRSTQNWELGTFAGNGFSPAGLDSITLTGVHFLRRSLDALLPSPAPDAPAPETRRGRKPVHDWDAATAAIWGQIFRGELIPDNQAKVEKAFQLFLTKKGAEPSESTVRPYANRVWEEFKKEGL